MDVSAIKQLPSGHYVMYGVSEHGRMLFKDRHVANAAAEVLQLYKYEFPLDAPPAMLHTRYCNTKRLFIFDGDTMHGLDGTQHSIGALSLFDQLSEGFEHITALGLDSDFGKRVLRLADLPERRRKTRREWLWYITCCYCCCCADCSVQVT